MKILTWWKEVEFPDMPGVTCKIVPIQTAKEDQAFFAQVLKAVQASDFSYSLVENTDTFIEGRA